MEDQAKGWKNKTLHKPYHQIIKSSQLPSASETPIPCALQPIEVAILAGKLVCDGTSGKAPASGSDLCAPLQGKKFKGNLAETLH